jgi:lipopolysaccharide/colanic/teichoic acid biosynthesis glycosyltransferase
MKLRNKLKKLVDALVTVAGLIVTLLCMVVIAILSALTFDQTGVGLA